MMRRVSFWVIALFLCSNLFAEFQFPFGKKETSVEVAGQTLRTDHSKSNPLYSLLVASRSGENELSVSDEEREKLEVFLNNLVSEEPNADLWKLFVSGCEVRSHLEGVTPYKSCSTPSPYKLVRATSANKIAEAFGSGVKTLGSYLDFSSVKGLSEALDRIKKSIPKDEEQATLQGIVLGYSLKVIRAGSDLGAQQEYVAKLIFDLIKTKMAFHPEMEKMVLGQLVSLLKSSGHAYRSIPGMPVGPRGIHDQAYLRLVSHGLLRDLAERTETDSKGFSRVLQKSLSADAGKISRDVSGLRFAFQEPLAKQVEQLVREELDGEILKEGQPTSYPVVEGILSHLNWALTEGYALAKKAEAFELPTAETLARHQKKFVEKYTALQVKETQLFRERLEDLEPKEISAPGWNIATREFLRKQFGHDLLVQAMAILRAISTEDVKEIDTLLESLASYEKSLREGAELGVVRVEEMASSAFESANKMGEDLLKKSKKAGEDLLKGTSKAGEDLLKESSKAGQDLLKKFKGFGWK